VTINIAVLTSEALALSCDSIASVTEYFVDPFTRASERAEDGRLKVTVTATDIVPQVTNTWDGVTKLFLLQGGSCPVAAATAGLAKLNNRSMSSYAKQFLSEHGGSAPVEPPVTFVGSRRVKPVLDTVEEVAQEFLTFMREHYDSHYGDTKVPEEYRDGPLFLVGGYDRDNHLSLHPGLHRPRASGSMQEYGRCGSVHASASARSGQDPTPGGHRHGTSSCAPNSHPVGPVPLRHCMWQSAATRRSGFGIVSGGPAVRAVEIRHGRPDGRWSHSRWGSYPS
jgi:hypothetical protein